MKTNIPVAQPDISGNELKYLTDCIKSGWVSSIGNYITKFEKLFAEQINCKYAISTSNGTAALHLALVALNIGRGDEVIVPDLTFVATANAVTYTGAKPVLVDVESETWNIAAKKIVNKITRKTKAIIVVHLYGHPADMDLINSIAKKYSLIVIEDAAEAQGALYKSKPVGQLGDIGCFSFYGNKIITTGEGGMISLNNKKLASRILFLKDHAMSQRRRYYHPIVGYNYRMTNLQAAVGLGQLEKIKLFIKKKRENAVTYGSFLKDITDFILLPPEMPWAQSVYWMYSIVIKNPNRKNLRNKLMYYLKERGIDSRPFFVPLHLLPMYRQNDNFEVSSYIARNGINLPSSTLLKRDDICNICETIRKFFNKYC